MKFIGIDPGEAWTGVVRLRIDRDERWLADMRVLDMKNRDFYHAVNAVMLGSQHHVIVCERFQMRDEGHNTFNSGWTLQLIGALRYVTETAAGIWQTVPPGNPDKHLQAMGIARYIERWQALCPQPNHANWQHARSAWRVLGHYLLTRHPTLLASLMKNNTFNSFAAADTDLRLPVTADCFDLLAPPVMWEHRRA